MKKLIALFLILFCIKSYSSATTLEELTEPIDFMGKITVGDKIEKRKEKPAEIVKIEKKATIEQPEIEQDENEIPQQEESTINTNYADLSLKKLANDVALELEIDENKINSDLSILWNATTERSETMKYTIYKLANPDEDKPNDSVMKKILKPIANISSLAGASVSGNPFVATGALIGGGLVNAFMKNDKEANYAFSKVSDADMVLLIRKIDTLQKKLIDLYIDYKTKENVYKMESENLEKREEIFNASKNKSKEELTIVDVYYRNSKIRTQKAYDEFLTSRAILENLVGKDAINKIEEDNS